MKIKENIKQYIAVLVSAVLFVIIFNNALYWPDNIFPVQRILVYVFSGLFIAGIPVLCIHNKKILARINAIFSFFPKKVTQIKEDPLKYLFTIIVYGTETLVILGIMKPVCYFMDKSFDTYLFGLICVAAYILTTAIIFRKTIGEKPEWFFMITIMLCGLLFIRVSPITPGISWDDETHYQRTIALIDVIDNNTYNSDVKIISETGMKEPVYDRYYKEILSDYINHVYKSKEGIDYIIGGISIWSTGYIPAVIGILFGRGLGLPFEYMYMFGKATSLLGYAILVFLSMRKVKYGKILIACVGLIPTAVFIASNYSYDPWVTGFVMYGYASLFGILQDKNRKISVGEAIAMPILVMIGLFPKAIYFPLLFPFLFLSKEKFTQPKHKKYMILTVFIAGLILLSSFLLPILIKGAGIGDFRGGEDVNAANQITYILENPMEYLGILFKFLGKYIAIENSHGYTQTFAYMGNGNLPAIVFLTFSIVAFLDRSPEKFNMNITRITFFVALFGVLILVPTALYIEFTPVAYDDIMGCQYRYLLPIVFPTLFCIAPNGTSVKINKTLLTVVPMMIIAATLLINIYTVCISKT